MSLRRRVVLFVAAAVLAATGATAYGLAAFDRHQDRLANAPDVAQTEAAAITGVPHVVFRHTAIGNEFGLVAMVALDDPEGPRAITDVACDRVYATDTERLCLRTNTGVTNTFEAEVLDADWEATESWPLPGVPSRTRLSPDGTLGATTSFVTGHSYATTGFSTETRIRELGGSDYGNLEDFDLVVDGEPVTASDRNFWGVTFGADGNTFYATAASGGHTWLVRGDLAERRLTAVEDNAECPSLSPNGTRIAYKKSVDESPQRWAIAVLDLATGEETLLGEKANVDDQVEWLDDDTVLYGLPRADDPGVTDVWALDTTADAKPQLFIPQAWSPSVVR